MLLKIRRYLTISRERHLEGKKLKIKKKTRKNINIPKAYPLRRQTTFRRRHCQASALSRGLWLCVWKVNAESCDLDSHVKRDDRESHSRALKKDTQTLFSWDTPKPRNILPLTLPSAPPSPTPSPTLRQQQFNSFLFTLLYSFRGWWSNRKSLAADALAARDARENTFCVSPHVVTPEISPLLCYRPRGRKMLFGQSWKSFDERNIKFESRLIFEDSGTDRIWYLFTSVLMKFKIFTMSFFCSLTSVNCNFCTLQFSWNSYFIQCHFNMV